jgi:hypothetical protein
MKNSPEEQDQAAGGKECRELRLGDGTVVTASIAIRTFIKTPNQSYGYLQFKVLGKTVTKYVGRVTADTRAASLRIGWAMVRQRKLAQANGWQWVRRGKSDASIRERMSPEAR